MGDRSSGATGSRRTAREAALQILYLMDTCQTPPEGGWPEKAWSEEPLAPKTRAFAQHLVEGVAGNLARLDALIVKYAQNWDMNRMAALDRCLLRLAAYELVSDLETPVSVVINEAVEIAKKYSTADSGKFVNGILDKIKLERGADASDAHNSKFPREMA